MDKINITTITEELGITPHNDIVILDDVKLLNAPQPTREMLIEGFVFGIMQEGNARIIIDDVEYTLNAGDIFGCNPTNILTRSLFSLDIKFIGFFVSTDYTTRLLQKVNIDWSFLVMAKTHEILHATEEQTHRITTYLNLLRSKLNAPDSNHKQESIDLLVQSFGLEIFDIHEQQATPQHLTDYSSAEHLFQRFLLMLTEAQQHGKRFLNVNGYAEQLNVTAKYFSLICKKISGKTASEIINDRVLNTAMVLLHDNGLSIKQISDRLGFANQSHFGTFFRRHTGISPQAYKRQ